MTYRILSLDGGGSWALVQVHALSAIYGKNTKGHSILSNFDMAAANSGGSLVLGGLLEDLSLVQIQHLFEDETERRKIFSPTRSFLWRMLKNIVGPKYSEKAKLPAIMRALPLTGNKPLTSVAEGIKSPGGKDIHILIVAFNYYRNRATFLRSAKTNAHGHSGWGTGNASTCVTLAECIHASTNAPIKYFDAPAALTTPDNNGELYWDGGITGNNNPVLAAIIEAMGLGHDPLNISVLSIGTGNVVLPLADTPKRTSVFYSPRTRPRFVSDLKKLALSILDDPPDAATYIAHVITGLGKNVSHPAVSRIVRMNPLVSPVRYEGTWDAPANLNATQFEFLANIDMDATDAAEINAIKYYAVQWLNDNAPNQPIRMDGKTLACEVGYQCFSEALRAWKAI